MTGDKTQVDADELDAFKKSADARSTDTKEAAKAVTNIHLGSDMLGPMFLDFAHNSASEQHKLATKLGAMVAVLKQDGEIAQANAKTVRANEDQQVDGFKKIEGS